jgi:hypothetical protein
VLTKLHARHPSHPTVANSLQDGLAGRAYTKHLLQQYAAALLDWDRALALPADRQRSFFLAGQANTRAAFEAALDAQLQAGEFAAAAEMLRAFAAQLEQADGMFYLAGVCAARSAAIQKPAPPETVEALAALAVDLLRRAQVLGYFEEASHLRQLAEDDRWQSIRAREDFQALRLK